MHDSGRIGRCLVSVLLLAAPAAGGAAEALDLDQAARRVLATYPTLQAAQVQLERARRENARVESQLGWALGAQAGVARDLSIIGSPTDRADASANLQRRLESGSSVGIEAGYSHEDSNPAFSPVIPNPLSTTRLDLSYRQPWGRGSDNPEYRQGLVSAAAAVDLAESELRARRDQVLAELGELFYAAALTAARLRQAKAAVDRAERLRAYVQGRLRLGLSEDKDILQAEAQLNLRRADAESLRAAWIQQRSGLNRLMGRDWNAEFDPVLARDTTPPDADTGGLWREVATHSPELLRQRARLAQAEADIERSRDARRDQFDLVYSVGNRSRSGNVAGGSSSDSELVGGVRLEYGRSLDRRGVDALLEQALLARDAARLELHQAEHDLRYNLNSLVAEIDANQRALAHQHTSLASEQAKFEEATARYRAGRTETDRLIQYESELYAAALAVDQQTVDLARRRHGLALLRGAGDVYAAGAAAGGAKVTP